MGSNLAKLSQTMGFKDATSIEVKTILDHGFGGTQVHNG